MPLPLPGLVPTLTPIAVSGAAVSSVSMAAHAASGPAGASWDPGVGSAARRNSLALRTGSGS
ncbi:hypothetical protein DFLDMN_003279 [Cupriavidus sp. H19C3]|uniref:hypothetical protein n=1 Tax=Cupriavidus sp. H19C3 TaxID=3241603 RepID=UPI003BF8431D